MSSRGSRLAGPVHSTVTVWRTTTVVAVEQPSPAHPLVLPAGLVESGAAEAVVLGDTVPDGVLVRPSAALTSVLIELV